MKVRSRHYSKDPKFLLDEHVSVPSLIICYQNMKVVICNFNISLDNMGKIILK